MIDKAHRALTVILNKSNELLECMLGTVLVHGQVTIIFVVSVSLFVCLFVCLFVQSFSAVFDPIWIKLGHMLHVWV